MDIIIGRVKERRQGRERPRGNHDRIRRRQWAGRGAIRQRDRWLG
jgi:hypothetical protein